MALLSVSEPGMPTMSQRSTFGLNLEELTEWVSGNFKSKWLSLLNLQLTHHSSVIIKSVMKDRA